MPKFRDIPQFTPNASYQIDVGWDYLQVLKKQLRICRQNMPRLSKKMKTFGKVVSIPEMIKLQILNSLSVRFDKISHKNC